MSGGCWNYMNDSAASEILGYHIYVGYGLDSDKHEKNYKQVVRDNPLGDPEISALVYDVFCLLHSYEQITDIAQFLLYLLNEKDKLFAAIRTAKDALDIDMDSEVSLNATRQSIARTFKRMNDLRNSEQTISNGGTGYRFNAEGNQISYRCDVKRVTTINYDRNVIRAELGKLNRLADETSTKIDLCLVTSKVDYEPPFDANSSFAEAFEAYTENARA